MAPALADCGGTDRGGVTACVTLLRTLVSMLPAPWNRDGSAAGAAGTCSMEERAPLPRVHGK